METVDTPSPERAAEDVLRRFDGAGCDLSVFWLRVPTGRDAYAARVRELVGDKPVVVIVVRTVRFDNPNSLMADLASLFDEAKEACLESLGEVGSDTSKFAFLLLSRTDFRISQASSPVEMPTWFPILGGRQVFCVVDDLSWRIEVSLNALELDTGELNRRLFELEGALLRRLEFVSGVDSIRLDPLGAVLARRPEEQIATILRRARDHHRSVANPDAYRPTVSDGKVIIARLWGIAQAKPMELQHAVAKALTTALHMAGEDYGVNDSLVAVISRPSKRERFEEDRLSRNLILTVAATFQYITCAAHADAYARYPLSLLRAMTLNLRDTLAEIESALNQTDALRVSSAS